jgi:ribose transport system substrate-binding protein
MVGATFFGVNNYQAGHVAGRALGEWIREHWDGRLDCLYVLQELRAGALPALRIQGQLDGLSEVIGEVPASRRTLIDSGNTVGITEAHLRDALVALAPDSRFAVLSFNDDSATGAIRAIRHAGRQNHAIVVGQGCDRLGREEMRRPDSLLVGSTAFMPERYGPRLLQLAQRILGHEPVPPAVYGDYVFVTPDNLEEHYPSEPELKPWTLRSPEVS